MIGQLQDLSDADRLAVFAACGVAAAELRATIVGEVKQSEEVDEPVGKPWARTSVRMVAEGPETLIVTRDSAANAAARGASSAAGESERVGVYRLGGKIGEGGMGTVWRAEQTEPVRRTVAIKMARDSSAASECLQRFEMERQTLASMNHECVAGLLEAGETEDGRPYLVMEYVAGDPVTQFCKARSSSLTERLSVFQQICEGIRHAHQRGIIHRDIKPDNLLAGVAEDGRIRVWVIDFGLAREAASQRAAARTMDGQILGTLSYMSPEQSGGIQTEVDTRSDVYSLGAVLFELLTGTGVIPPKMFAGRTLPEMLQLVQEAEVPLMSQRIRASRDLADSEAPGVAEAMPKDLDLIVAKALAREPRRRYQTVDEFQDDLRRWERHEPVYARRASLGYLLRRYVRRNRIRVLVATTVLTALLAFGGWFIRGLELRNQELESAARELTLEETQRRELLLRFTGERGLAASQPEERLQALRDAADLEIVDAKSRCELQLLQLELLTSLQRAGETRELLEAIAPTSPRQEALLSFWKIRNLPGFQEERRMARALLDSPLARELTESHRLYLTALNAESRREASLLLEELLGQDPGDVAARKLLAACLLFTGRSDDARHHAEILRVIAAGDPETEVIEALSWALEGNATAADEAISQLADVIGGEQAAVLGEVMAVFPRIETLIRKWDMGGASLTESSGLFLQLISGLTQLDSDQQIVSANLKGLSGSFGLEMSPVDLPPGDAMLAYFSGRLTLLAGQIFSGHPEAVGEFLVELRGLSPIPNDAVFPFTAGVIAVGSKNPEAAVEHFRTAVDRDSMFLCVTEESLYGHASSILILLSDAAWAGDRDRMRSEAAESARAWVAGVREPRVFQAVMMIPLLINSGFVAEAESLLVRCEELYPGSIAELSRLRLQLNQSTGNFQKVLEAAIEEYRDAPQAQPSAELVAAADRAREQLAELLNDLPPELTADIPEEAEN